MAKHRRATDDPFPRRGLALPHVPRPDTAPALAHIFVEAVTENEGITLGYSADNIVFVDDFLQRFRDEGLSVEDFAETIFVAGSYVGQVLVVQAHGRWLAPAETAEPEASGMPLLVQLPGGLLANPLAKAFKRFHYGSADSLAYFYRVVTEPGAAQ